MVKLTQKCSKCYQTNTVRMICELLCHMILLESKNMDFYQFKYELRVSRFIAFLCFLGSIGFSNFANWSLSTINNRSRSFVNFLFNNEATLSSSSTSSDTQWKKSSYFFRNLGDKLYVQLYKYLIPIQVWDVIHLWFNVSVASISFLWTSSTSCVHTLWNQARWWTDGNISQM